MARGDAAQAPLHAGDPRAVHGEHRQGLRDADPLRRSDELPAPRPALDEGLHRAQRAARQRPVRAADRGDAVLEQ
jgi:hypothetical protein